MRMIPRQYQEEESSKILKVLKKYALAYIAWEERTGKSLTGVLVVEKSKAEHCLIITKAKAKKGWYETLLAYQPNKTFEVITYGMVAKYTGTPDIIILDEAHNYISGYPKPSATWKHVRKLVFGLPIIYISATPHAQGYQLLFHQFALSKWSPFNPYTKFYHWFKEFGKPYTIRAHGRDVAQYDKVQDDRICRNIEHLFNVKTRKELGFKHEPKDEVIYVELLEKTKRIYNTIVNDNIYDLFSTEVLYDSVMKLRSGLHMIEGGTLKTTLIEKPKERKELLLVNRQKVEDTYLYHAYYDLGNREKINYIKQRWGDTENVAIMYNYKGEKVILEKAFKHARILQATSNAEGIELSHVRHLIIYSQDFSTARHTQRRARQASKDRKHDIEVHFLLTKKGISHQVYRTVSINKKNYVDSVFIRETI